VYYIANIVGIYKEALAHSKKINSLAKELSTKLVHRGYTTGFLLGGKADQNTENTTLAVGWEFCGQVIKSESKAGQVRILVKVHNTLKTGDEIEIILPYYDIIKTKVGDIFVASTGEKIAEAHGGGGGQTIYLDVKAPRAISRYVVIRRKIN
jgi:hypothetical protein